MASIIKHKNGWRALVARKGVRKSKVFPTRQEAKDWAARQEYLALNAKQVASATLFRDALDRYAREVSPTKRGRRWEEIRLLKLQSDQIARKAISDITPQDLADWRDRRLREVSPGSVLREMSLLAAVFSQATREWGMIADSPLKQVRKPKPPRPRDRLPTADEIDRMAALAGDDLTKKTARAFHAFLFAGETAMRAGEIVGLTWDRVFLADRYVRLEQTKNGTARDVPLSSRAVELIEALPDLDPVFGLSSSQLESLFRKLRMRAGVEGLTFHDSRAFATLKLSRKVDALTLAKITGHQNVNMLIRVYYRESASDIATRLG